MTLDITICTLYTCLVLRLFDRRIVQALIDIEPEASVHIGNASGCNTLELSTCQHIDNNGKDDVDNKR